MNMSQLQHATAPGVSAASSGRPHWRTLSVLCAVVAMGHWYLLQPDRTYPTPLLATAFDTRVIELGANLAAAPNRAPVAKPNGATPEPRPTPPGVVTPVPAVEPVLAPIMAAEPVAVATGPTEAEPVLPASPAAAAEPAPLPTAPPVPVPVPVPAPVPVPVPEQVASSAEPPQPPPTAEPSLPIRPPREAAITPGVVAVPPPARLLYRVESNKFPFRMSGELIWRQDGLSYDARLSMSAFGQARVQTSRGELGAQGLSPLRFSDKYRSEVAAHFERDKGRISFSANTPAVPLLAGAQDYLSVMIQLATVIGGEPARYPVATAITVQVAGPREAEVWLFTVERQETLRLPGGEQDTLKLVRHPRRQFDQEVAIWLAPAMNWLPVRLRITEPNGDYLDQKWEATEAPS